MGRLDISTHTIILIERDKITLIFKAKNGAEIIEKINISEMDALEKYPEINHALVIVKIENDYLLGWHKWRNDWETFGGILEERETLRECIKRECLEELGLSIDNFEYLGVIHYYMPPGYWNHEWHDEYGGLYGIRLSVDEIPLIERERKDKDEIGEIALYSELKKRKENIDEINEKLLEFFI